jgi:hypothetical protein
MGLYGTNLKAQKSKKIINCNIWAFIINNKIMTIINLLLIGYSIGFLIIAYFGIIGTLETIEYKNNQYKKERLKNEYRKNINN